MRLQHCVSLFFLLCCCCSLHPGPIEEKMKQCKHCNGFMLSSLKYSGRCVRNIIFNAFPMQCVSLTYGSCTSSFAVCYCCCNLCVLFFRVFGSLSRFQQNSMIEMIKMWHSERELLYLLIIMDNRQPSMTEEPTNRDVRISPAHEKRVHVI